MKYLPSKRDLKVLVIAIILALALPFPREAGAEILAQRLADHCESSRVGVNIICLAWINGYKAADGRCDASTETMSQWFVEEVKVAQFEHSDLIVAGILPIPASDIMKKVVIKRCK